MEALKEIAEALTGFQYLNLTLTEQRIFSILNRLGYVALNADDEVVWR